MVNRTYTYHIVAYNYTFTNITTKWHSRWNHSDSLNALVIAILVTCLIWMLAMYVIPKTLYNIYLEKFGYVFKPPQSCFTEGDADEGAVKLRSKSDREIDSASIKESNPSFCGCVNRLWVFITFVTVPVFKITWDAIDVVLDILIFYDVERGGVIDATIIRNTYVTNCILGFAVLGAVKMLLCTWIFSTRLKEYDNEQMVYVKVICYFLVFVLEDCPELFLEYFYLEKYFTQRPPLYILIKDVAIAFIALTAILTDVCSLLMFDRFTWLFLSTITIGLVNAFRVGGVAYQYVTGLLHPECLRVVNGQLIQYPFTRGCLREIDYAIIPLNFLPIIFGMLTVLRPCYEQAFVEPFATRAISTDDSAQDSRVVPRDSPFLFRYNQSTSPKMGEM